MAHDDTPLDGSTPPASADAPTPLDAGVPAPEPAPPALAAEPATDNDPPASRKRWVLAAMAALGVALFAIPWVQAPDIDSGSPPPSSTAVTPGAAGTCRAPEGTANFNFTMKDMNGASVKLADFKGKVVLLNFWATWCGPCKVEIPEFVDVYAQYKPRGFEILGVLAQDEPSIDDLRAFTSKYHMTYPILRSNEDFENAHGPIWALPTTYVIDRQGSICSKHMGPVSREMVEQEIKGLL